MKPYLTAAMRSGLLSGLPDLQTMDMEAGITGAEAAVVLQNVLDLPAGHEAMTYGEDVPAWAATSLEVLAGNGLTLEADAALTRGEAAQLLYQVSRLSVGAPGMMVFNMQK